ncbi:unnamed protein product [Diatraea saccharalis]|uniref:Uncharacterized protein n=1 Tax=Diatraea saccharalis TaxID=40085 RepID=A0A9N9QUV0_9NEOP|nr:unnamed protein product [Diatraea saccharalis]
MLSARLEGLEGRLLPAERLRPSLAADRKKEERRKAGTREERAPSLPRRAPVSVASTSKATLTPTAQKKETANVIFFVFLVGDYTPFVYGKMESVLEEELLESELMMLELELNSEEELEGAVSPNIFGVYLLGDASFCIEAELDELSVV